MATSLEVQVGISVRGQYTNTTDLGSSVQKVGYAPVCNFSNGTGAEQANKYFEDTRTLTASSTEDLDLYGGLTDVFGNTLNITKIKFIIIRAAATNTNDVVVGGAAGSPIVSLFGTATDKINLKPGTGICLFATDSTAYAVVTSTADLLKVANGGGTTSVSYDIIIGGV